MNKFSDNGFVLFSESSSYIAETIQRYIDQQARAKRVILVPHGKKSDPLLVGAIKNTLSIECHEIPWESYGETENIAFVSSVQSEAILLVMDFRHMVGNRLDTRLDHMYTFHKPLMRIVVDSAPYQVQPWKIYFPYGMFNRHLLEYNHSYAIEGDWNKWIDGISEKNPCDVKSLVGRTGHVTFCDMDSYFHATKSEIIPAGDIVSEYEKYRDHLFDTCSGISSVKSKLNKWIQERFPSRNIPANLGQLYKRDTSEIVRTDLKFDNWLEGEINFLINHTNSLLAGYKGGIRE